MNKAVEVASAFFNLLAHVVVDFHVEDIGDEVKRMLVVLDLRVETGEIEAVG